jgi:phenylacetate-coenzyme A ligase PaaK-like adenylate-forming protein
MRGDTPIITSVEDWHVQLNDAFKGYGGTVYSSSGSTGPSKSILYTGDVLKGAILRTQRLMALTPFSRGDKTVILWGYGLFPPAHFYTLALGEIGARVYPLGSGRNFPTELKIEELSKIHPNVIVGMPSYIVKIGEMLRADGLITGVRADLKCIVTGGEILSVRLRKKVAKIFGVPIYDHYGMLQAPMIAGECRYHRLHIINDYKPEVLTDSNTILSSGKGVLLLSSDIAWSPLEMTRLKTNDVVTLDKTSCPCGFHTPSVIIHGRANMVHKVRGQQIDFSELVRSLNDSGFEESYFFEVIKDPTDHLVVHIKREKDEIGIRAEIQKHAAISYSIQSHLDFALPLSNTGKALYFVIRQEDYNSTYDFGK